MVGLLIFLFIALGVAIGAVMAAVALVREMGRGDKHPLLLMVLGLGVLFLIGVVLAAGLFAFLCGSCLADGWMHGGQYGFHE